MRHKLLRKALTWAALAALTALVVTGITVPTSTAVAETMSTTFTTPLLTGTGADPDIQTYNGKYYMLYNGNHTGTEIRMRVAASIGGLADGAEIGVWTPPPSMSDICCHVGWGGYLFPSGGKWYIYMQGDDGNQLNARSFVLESAGSDPAGSYAFKAYIPGVVGNLGYAAGPALVGSQLYIFQTYEGGIYAAKASNPWTLSTTWSLIAQASSSGWECANGRCIDEGSNVIVHGGKVFNIFSAGGYESPDYCVGMLTADASADLTVQSSWSKSPGCVFSRNNAVGSYGPGSMTWFSSPDGTEDWVAYHAKTSTGVTFGGEDRRLLAKKVTWNGDGTPNFGSPQAIGASVLLPSGDSGTMNSAPTASSWSSDNETVYARGSDEAVHYRRWSSAGGWTAWTSLGNSGTGAVLNPGSESRASGVSDVFTLQVDGNIAHRWYSGGTWSSWEQFGAPAGGGTTAPTGASWGADRQSVYVRGANGNLWERWWASSPGWSAWQDLGAPSGGVQSAAAAVSRTTNYVDVFVRSSGNEIATKYWNGSSWSSWASMGQAGGGAVSAPAAASWGSDRLHVYVLAKDGQIYEKYWWSMVPGWSSWQSVGAPSVGAASAPAVVSRATNLTDLFVRGLDGHVYIKSWNGSSWSSWTDFGTP